MKEWQPVGGENYPVISKGLACPTTPYRPIESIGDYSGLSNRSAVDETKNPGALAGATGAESIEQAFYEKVYQIRAARATSLCLAIGDCDPRDACEIMVAALSDLAAGQPSAPLLSFMDTAAFWADLACETELKAYLLACWSRLSPTSQAGFLAYVGGAAA